VQVTLAPAGAVTAGAQWQVDGGAYQTNGAVVASLLTNTTHTVAFKPVSGWVAPTNQTLTATAGVTNLLTGTYVQVAAPVITNLTVQGTNVALKGTGTAGAAFSVLSTNNLALPVTNWPAIYTGTITGGMFLYNGLHGTSSPVFYRVSSQ
jgi:hypothetical protein